MTEYPLGLPLMFLIAFLINYAMRNRQCVEGVLGSATTILAMTVLLWDIFWDGFLGELVYLASGILTVGYTVTLLVWLHERRGGDSSHGTADRAQLNTDLRTKR